MKRFLLLFFVIACSYVNVSGQKNIHASFTVDTAYGCGPITVKFTNTSTGNDLLWYWEFGDGTNSGLASPVHVYDKPGKYNARVIAYAFGESDTAYLTGVTDAIYCLPFSNMPGQHLYCGQPAKLSTGLENSTISQLTGFQWSTGATSPAITVNQPGLYTVQLNSCGQSFKDTVEVVNATAGMSLSLDEVFWHNTNAQVRFKYQIPFDNRAVSSLKIDYGDGDHTYDFYPGAANRFYPGAGNYRALITATMLPGANDGNCDTAAYLDFNIRESYITPSSWNHRDTMLLPGQKLVLRAGTPGASYTWLRSDGYVLSTDSVFTIDTDGRYSLTMIKNGDTSENYINVDYKQPSVVAILSNSFENCGLVSFSDMSYATTYPIVKRIWYFGDGAVDSTSSNPDHLYVNGGYYTPKLVVKNSIGEADSAFGMVTIMDYPPIRLTEDTAIATGSSLYLTDLNANSYDFTWSTGEKGDAIYVTEPGLYFVTGTTSCPSVIRRDSVYVTIDDLVIQINQGAYFACGDSTSFTAVISGTQETYSYSWNTGDTTASIQVAAPGFYTLTLKNQDGSIRKRKSVYIEKIPSFQVVLQPVNGDEHLIEALIDSSSVNTGYTFRWFKNSAQLSYDQNTLQLTDSGYYEVQVINNATSCSSISAPYYLYGSGYGGEVIVPDSSITGNDSMAVNTSFAHDFNTTNRFTVQLTLKDPGARMTQEDVINIGSMPGTSRNVSMKVYLSDTLPCATGYAVRVVASSPADTSAWSQQFTVTNQPPQPVIIQHGDSLFTSGKYNLQWYFNDKAIEGATGAAYQAKSNGIYTVQAMNGNDCSSKSAPLSVVMTSAGDVTLNGNKVKAYPNPSEGEVYLQFEKPLQKAVTIKVYSHNGRVVYTRSTTQQIQLLDLSKLPKGFYVIAISGTKKTLSLILQ